MNIMVASTARIFLVVVSALVWSSPAAAVVITFAAQDVRVENATPAGKVLLVGIERTGFDYKTRLRQHRALLPADAAGTLVVQTGVSLHPESVWLAVDVASGDYIARTVSGAPPRQLQLSPELLKKENNGQLKKLLTRLPRAYFLLVRPGGGAWHLMAGDGVAGDTDGSLDGATVASIDGFTSMGGSDPAPHQFTHGDRLFVISPDQVALAVITVK